MTNPGASKKLKVLVVDDDENITLALKLIVGSGFPCESVDIAGDGREAWKKIQEGTYDLVLSDWNMPGMDGNQLLQAMRKDPRASGTAFLMLTVRRDVESVASAVKAGVTDYVIKPFDKAALIKRIEKLLGMKALQSVTSSAEGTPPPAPGHMDRKAIAAKAMELIGKGDISLPAMPQIIFTIEDTLKREDADIHDLSKVIEMDAGISSKLIGVANSVYYRGTKECDMVEEAIMRLGMQETKQLVYLISNRNLFALKDRRYEETIKQLYVHSIASGAAGQALAQYLHIQDTYNFFAMGLFHDIGKLLVIKVLSEITRDMHGLDLTGALSIMDELHNKVGYMLLSKWEFPQIYAMAAINHQDISALENPEKELLVVYFANILTRKMGFSMKKEDGRNILEDHAAKLLDLNGDVLGRVERDVSAHMEKVLNII